jgi:hypothetical protein
LKPLVYSTLGAYEVKKPGFQAFGCFKLDLCRYTTAKKQSETAAAAAASKSATKTKTRAKSAGRARALLPGGGGACVDARDLRAGGRAEEHRAARRRKEDAAIAAENRRTYQRIMGRVACRFA